MAVITISNIVGRGGRAILHDRPATLHVRIVCPLEHRTYHITEH